MSLEMNDARLAILGRYIGTIDTEEDEIVVRIRFDRCPKIAEMVYNKLVDAVEDENDGRRNNP